MRPSTDSNAAGSWRSSTSVLGAAVLSVPLAAVKGDVTSAQLFAVAGLYGFLKMANWAGVPSIVPALVVDTDDLATANAMESVSFGIADIAGPAAAGVLIAMIGATSVLGIDAASYLIFVIVLLSLPPQAVPARSHGERGLRLRPAFRFIRNDRAVFATTVMFMFANIGEGMMIVVIPVYAREVLGGGAGTYGLLLSAFALATTAGAALVGGMTWRRPLGRSIAASQALFGLSYAPLIALPGIGAGCRVCSRWRARSDRRSRSGPRPCGCSGSPARCAGGCSGSCERSCNRRRRSAARSRAC